MPAMSDILGANITTFAGTSVDWYALDIDELAFDSGVPRGGKPRTGLTQFNGDSKTLNQSDVPLNILLVHVYQLL